MQENVHGSVESVNCNTSFIVGLEKGLINNKNISTSTTRSLHGKELVT